jgi:hypothetical protein
MASLCMEAIAKERPPSQSQRRTILGAKSDAQIVTLRTHLAVLH